MVLTARLQVGDRFRLIRRFEDCCDALLSVRDAAGLPRSDAPSVSSRNLPDICATIRSNRRPPWRDSYALPQSFFITASLALTSSTSAWNSGSSRWCALPMAVAFV